MNNLILSIDAETNGLYGAPFAIGAVLFNEAGEDICRWDGRCNIEGEINSFVADNVIPALANIPINYKNTEDMLYHFFKWYMLYKLDADIIVHMGCPVEAGLFIRAHELGYIGDFDGPYPLIDISAFQEIGVSVDSYNTTHGITIPPLLGGAHNPLYDAYAAAYAYMHLMKGKK